MGVDVLNDGVCDTFLAGVWEPAANKLNSLASATEAACCILLIDETVQNPQSEKPGATTQGVGLDPGGGGEGDMGYYMWIYYFYCKLSISYEITQLYYADLLAIGEINMKQDLATSLVWVFCIICSRE